MSSPSDSVAAILSARGCPWPAPIVVAETESTNADVAAMVDTAAAGTSVWADCQTRGRGRLGREWVSPPGAGVWLSVLVRPDVADAEWGWLPLLTGVAVRDGIERATAIAFDLKWPNDVINVGNEKVAGILVERRGEAAIIGVGINVDMDPLPAPTATTLALSGWRGDRAEIVGEVLSALYERLEQWAADSAAVRDAYRESCATIGKSIRLVRQGEPDAIGAATGIDELGRLVIDGLTAVAAGDVTHIRPVT